MKSKISKAAAEVIELLNHLSPQMVEKIPVDFIKKLKKISSKNENIRINDSIRLIEQGLSKEAIHILIMIYRNYWCTEEERIALDKTLVMNEKNYRKARKGDLI